MNNFILNKCDKSSVNILDLLQENNKSNLIDFFNSNSTWASAVLDSINQRLEILELLTPNTDIMIDVGAHIGLFSLFAEPFCKNIYCLEPTTKHFDMLKLLVDNYPKIKVFKLALGINNEELDFYEDMVNNTQNSLIPHQQSIKSGTVKTINLSNFLIENKLNQIDLLKMDIEGFELPLILHESFNIVSHKINKIYIETHNIEFGPLKCHQSQNQNLINQKLIRLGFTIKNINDIILARK